MIKKILMLLILLSIPTVVLAGPHIADLKGSVIVVYTVDKDLNPEHIWEIGTIHRLGYQKGSIEIKVNVLSIHAYNLVIWDRGIDIDVYPKDSGKTEWGEWIFLPWSNIRYVKRIK